MLGSTVLFKPGVTWSEVKRRSTGRHVGTSWNRVYICHESHVNFTINNSHCWPNTVGHQYNSAQISCSNVCCYFKVYCFTDLCLKYAYSRLRHSYGHLYHSKKKVPELFCSHALHNCIYQLQGSRLARLPDFSSLVVLCLPQPVLPSTSDSYTP